MNEGFPVWYELMTSDPAKVAGYYREVAGLCWSDEGGPMPNGATYRNITRADGSTAGGLLAYNQQMLDAGMPGMWAV